MRQRVLRVCYSCRIVVGKICDAAYGIQTESKQAFTAFDSCPDGERYEPAPYRLLHQVVRRLKPTPDDVVFDLGCGKGRALAVFSRQSVRRVVGVELDPVLACAASENAQRVRGRRSPIEVLNQNAVDVNYDSGTIFFLFNPFGAETLKRVLERIRGSLDQDPRRIQIAYYNPEHSGVLEGTRWLETSPWGRRFPFPNPKRVLFAVTR